jgi:hypothetical protein
MNEQKKTLRSPPRSAVAAAKSVTITGGAAAADDNRLSVHVTTVGGASAAGLTSDNSGGTVTLQGPTDLQLTGNILSGGTMQQQFNSAGENESVRPIRGQLKNPGLC